MFFLQTAGFFLSPPLMLFLLSFSLSPAPLSYILSSFFFIPPIPLTTVFDCSQGKGTYQNTIMKRSVIWYFDTITIPYTCASACERGYGYGRGATARCAHRCPWGITWPRGHDGIRISANARSARIGIIPGTPTPSMPLRL